MSEKIRDEVLRDAVIGAVERCCTDDKPTSLTIESENFVLRLSEKAKPHWAAITRWMMPPDGSAVAVDEYRWPSHADQIFGNGGTLSTVLDGYESRTAQLQAARMVQRSIEMGVPAVIEAGTGTGKSLMYLLIARAMGKRVIVSTSNKALQQQLYKKDAPFVASIFPSKIAIAQGKGNYVCNARAAKPSSVENPKLIQWLSQTTDGDLESIDFQVDYKDLKKVNVDDSCVGLRKCQFAHTCYYAEAKEARSTADIVICNHALLALSQKYSEMNLLPEGLIVVDEAHNFAQYAQNVLGHEFSITGLVQLFSEIGNYDAEVPDASEFILEIRNYKKDKKARYEDTEIGINSADEIASGIVLASDLLECAEEIWDTLDVPVEPQEIRAARFANRVRSMAENIRSASLPTVDGFVRWIGERERIYNKPYDVSRFIGSMAGFYTSVPRQHDPSACARCGAVLTAPTVHIYAGRPFGPTCIDYVDPLGECEVVPLNDWLAMDHEIKPTTRHSRTPIVFTSATLAAPNLDHFMRSSGLDYALTMQAESPFDYSKSQLYVPNGNSPGPKSYEWQEWAQDEMERIINATGGGVFLLFTSTSAMHKAFDRLRSRISFQIYLQGDFPKMEIIRRMKTDGNAVLFATKSFFEGVDIKGNALRAVVIDKIPFAPLTPFNNARSEAIKKSGGNPFRDLTMPEAAIDLKQGVGRLIRSADDFGMVAILDNRLNERWAKPILESLPDFEIIRDVPEPIKINELSALGQWVVYQ